MESSFHQMTTLINRLTPKTVPPLATPPPAPQSLPRDPSTHILPYELFISQYLQHTMQQLREIPQGILD